MRLSSTFFQLDNYMRPLRYTLFLLLLWPLYGLASPADKAEVIHWWISAGESRALNVIVDAFEEKGYRWLDTPVETSFHAKSAALSRILDGHPPVMMQWHAGISLKNLWNEGILRDIDHLAQQQNWQQKLPDAIWNNISVDDHIVAVPVTLHVGNWLWGNRQILDELGLSPPQSWDGFLKMAPKIAEAGYIPLAVGGQAWQERSLFMTVLLGTGGPKLFQEAFTDHKESALSGPAMIKALETFKKLKAFTDKDSPGRSWSDTASLVTEKKAAFMVMGDWVKGEFLQAGLVPDKDFTCTLSPGSHGKIITISDVFAMARVSEETDRHMQTVLAEILMDPDIQQKFSLHKGSIPPLQGVDPSPFDTCAQLAMEMVSKPATTLPGFNMSNSGIMASAIMAVIHSFWEGEDSPHNAAKALAQAIRESDI